MASKAENTFFDIAGSLPLVGGFFEGMRQKKAARGIQTERPIYTIPEGVGANVNTANTLASTSKLQGQNLMEEAIKANFEGAFEKSLQNITSNADLLANLNTMNTGVNQSIQGLNIEGSRQRLGNYDRLMRARSEQADYKNLAFDYNQNEPYLLQEKRKRELGQAATQNIQNANQNLIDVAGVAAQAMGGGVA